MHLSLAWRRRVLYYRDYLVRAVRLQPVCYWVIISETGTIFFPDGDTSYIGRALLDGYEDDKVKCKFVKKTGIKAEIECETELTPDEAASYCKGLFKKDT
mgnify:CR=1 FL=1